METQGRQTPKVCKASNTFVAPGSCKIFGGRQWSAEMRKLRKVHEQEKWKVPVFRDRSLLLPRVRQMARQSRRSTSSKPNHCEATGDTHGGQKMQQLRGRQQQGPSSVMQSW